jgi:hypothetical protein
VQFDKITARIKKLCYGLDDRYVDPIILSQKVIQGEQSLTALSTCFKCDLALVRVSPACHTPPCADAVMSCRRLSVCCWCNRASCPAELFLIYWLCVLLLLLLLQGSTLV